MTCACPPESHTRLCAVRQRIDAIDTAAVHLARARMDACSEQQALRESDEVDAARWRERTDAQIASAKRVLP